MMLLNYTKKKVIGISKYKKLLDKEISRVKSFTDNKNK